MNLSQLIDLPGWFIDATKCLNSLTKGRWKLVMDHLSKVQLSVIQVARQSDQLSAVRWRDTIGTKASTFELPVRQRIDTTSNSYLFYFDCNDGLYNRFRSNLKMYIMMAFRLFIFIFILFTCVHIVVDGVQASSVVCLALCKR
jgi:hypothetical protein